VKHIVAHSVIVGAAALLSAVVYDGGMGGAFAGAAGGVAASFAILALRVRSVRRVLASETRGEAGRSAFMISLGKLSLAFAALGMGACFGKVGAVAALCGLMTTTVGTVLGAFRAAKTGG
jgi:hypothetical protein